MTEHAGRRSLIVAILGNGGFSRVGGAVAAMERTGHRLASLFLPPVIRRPSEAFRDPYESFPLWEGNHFVPRVNSSQEPMRGLSNRLVSLLGFVALHERNPSEELRAWD